MLRSILTVTLLCVASPALAHPSCLATKQPPAVVEPTVPYRIFSIPRAEVHKTCGPLGTRDVTACSYQAKDGWQIVISNDLSLPEYACLVHYEKSHLPPNYWGDPAIETPDTITVLKRLKAAN